MLCLRHNLRPTFGLPSSQGAACDEQRQQFEVLLL